MRAARGDLDEALYARLATDARVALASPVLELGSYALDRNGQRVALRIVGVDAPELAQVCWRDKVMTRCGEEAREEDRGVRSVAQSGAQQQLDQLPYEINDSVRDNFRRAAERVGVTQPSLSEQISLLEESLGARLVERGSGAVHLTPIGREVLQRAQRALSEVQGLIDVAQSDSDALAGTLRLGVSPTLGPYLMPHLVSRLHREHRDLKLHVREGSPDDLIRDLGSGQHDLVLAQLPVGGDDHVVRRLFREPLLLAMAADDPLAKGEVVDPAALSGRSLLALSSRYRMSEQIVALGSELGAHVLWDYEGTSLDAIVSENLKEKAEAAKRMGEEMVGFARRVMLESVMGSRPGANTEATQTARIPAWLVTEAS